MANKRLRALFASIGLIWLFLLLSSLFILQPVSEAQTQRSSQPDYLAAYEIVGMLNEWRLEEGLYPLRLSDTLTDLALYQAEYVNSLSRTPNGVAIHVGRNGEGPKDRARYGRFNWPFYSLSSRIEVEEIAAANTASSAIAFWQSSRPHRRASTKPAYREVGVAALPHPFGHLYVVVLGGRPNVLPALVNPITNQLYLTTDESIYNTDDQWISNPTGVRFFDEAGRPLNEDFIEWEPTLEIPLTAGKRFFVLVTDGEVEVVTSVDRERDIIILPDHYPPLDEIAPIEYVLPPTDIGSCSAPLFPSFKSSVIRRCCCGDGEFNCGLAREARSVRRERSRKATIACRAAARERDGRRLEEAEREHRERDILLAAKREAPGRAVAKRDDRQAGRARHGGDDPN